LSLVLTSETVVFCEDGSIFLSKVSVSPVANRIR
jgi:hypothetical protein